MPVNFDALIAVNTFSVIILGIILAVCIMERRTSASHSNYFIAMMITEILFVIFNSVQYDTERDIIDSGSMALENKYIAMRGLSNVAFFLLMISFALYVFSYIGKKLG